MILYVSSGSPLFHTTSLHFAFMLQAWSAIKLIQIKVGFTDREGEYCALLPVPFALTYPKSSTIRPSIPPDFIRSKISLMFSKGALD
jgi:hypothetical protein